MSDSFKYNLIILAYSLASATEAAWYVIKGPTVKIVILKYLAEIVLKLQYSVWYFQEKLELAVLAT